MPWAIVTGGVGKDSGDLAIPEATYLAQVMEANGAPHAQILTETKATNGGENVRFSYALIRERGLHALPHFDTKGFTLTAVAHATSLRRLGLMVQTQARYEPDLNLASVYRAPSAYQFDSTNQLDQLEASSELLRLAEWPGMTNADGTVYLDLDPEMNRDDVQDLVEYARATKAHYAQQL